MTWTSAGSEVSGADGSAIPAAGASLLRFFFTRWLFGGSGPGIRREIAA